MNILLSGSLVASVFLTADVAEVEQDNTQTDSADTHNDTVDTQIGSGETQTQEVKDATIENTETNQKTQSQESSVIPSNSQNQAEDSGDEQGTGDTQDLENQTLEQDASWSGDSQTNTNAGASGDDTENDFYAPEQNDMLKEETATSEPPQAQQTIRNPILSNTLFVGGFSMLVFLAGAFVGTIFSWKRIKSRRIPMDDL